MCCRYPALLVAGLASTFLGTAAILALPWLFGGALDVLTAPEGSAADVGATAAGFLAANGVNAGLAPELFAGIAITAVGVVRCVLGLARFYAAQGLVHRVAADCRNLLFEKFHGGSAEFYDRTHTGRLMSVATADVDNVCFVVNAGLLGLVDVLVRLLVIPAVMLIISWQLALLCLALTPFVVLNGFIMFRRLRRHWARIQALTADLTVTLQDNLAGMRVVKAFAAEDYERSKYDRRASELRFAVVGMLRMQGTRRAWMGMYFALMAGAVMWWGGLMVVHGTITLGELVAFVSYLLLLAAPMRGMGQVIGAIARGVTSGHRLFGVLDAPSPVEERPGAIDPGRVAGHVRFDDVVFGYERSSPVLRGLSLEVEPGEVAVITGGSGSGKTTMADLLLRFYDVDGGVISIDGVDIRDLTLGALRRSVGVVYRDAYVFNATVRENIAYGVPGASSEEVVWAAAVAQLHDEIEMMPDGYDTLVGEFGVTLSGGQRQRLCIAREVLAHPAVLVLDDATSSVDVATERRIHESLLGALGDRTIIVVTHRPAELDRSYPILSLEGGKLCFRRKGAHGTATSDGTT